MVSRWTYSGFRRGQSDGSEHVAESQDSALGTKIKGNIHILWKQGRSTMDIPETIDTELYDSHKQDEKVPVNKIDSRFPRGTLNLM